MDRSAREVDRRVEELAQRCRAAGMNVTPQRLLVYRTLLESDDHPSPELLYRRVKRSMPSLSLATIYKALDALEQLGVVGQVSPTGDLRRYDANDEHHHHLICTRCQRVVDFSDRHFDALKAPGRLAGFVPQSVTVQVKGLCSDCAKPRKKGRA